MKKNYYFVLVFFFLCSCALASSNVLPKNEIVMTEGMKITANTDVGKITISAGKGFERSYTWDGDTRTVILHPRDERWAGKFGIYSKGDANWAEHNRITRGVLEESQLHFKSVQEAMLFLNEKFRKPYTVYNDEGLVVTWNKAIKPTSGPGSALLVEVYQIYINGQKPTNLQGSQNKKITVTY